MPTPRTSKREQAAINRVLDTPLFRTVAICSGLILELPDSLRGSACRMITEQVARVELLSSPPVVQDNGDLSTLGRLHDSNDTGE